MSPQRLLFAMLNKLSSLSLSFEHQKDCYGLTHEAAQHQTAICSLHSLIGWGRKLEMGKNWMLRYSLIGKNIYIIIMVKEYIQQVMNRSIAHHPLTNAQSVPKQRQPPWPTAPVSLLSMIPYVVGYPFGHFRSAVLVLFPPSSLSTPSFPLAGQHKMLRSP